MNQNYQDLENKGYNTRKLRALKRSRLFKTGLRLVAILLLVGVSFGLFVDYLARLPRERFARNYSYVDRAWLGAKKAFRAVTLALNAEPEDPKNTQLPIFELYIRGDRLDSLSEDLPESGTHYKKAEIKAGNQVLDARVRLRGDSINHWALPNKSWRVRLRKGERFKGMEVFNLNVPRVDTQISNWLGYRMAREIGGLLTPDANMVHFRLNRRYDGIRLMLEQPNQEFLLRRKLPPGKIFVGDIDSEHIYGGVKRKHLYKDSSAWEFEPFYEGQNSAEIQNLVSLIRNEHDPYRFYSKARDLINIESFARYMALLELVGSVHVDETHNGKLYFNPVTGRLEPIVWDTVAYMWKNTKQLDLGTNSLFRKLLGIPEVRERKDEILWETISKKLPEKKLHEVIQDISDRVRPDVYAFPLKLHANDKGIRHLSNEEWEQSIKTLHATVDERHRTIRQELQTSQAAYRVLPGEGVPSIAVQVRSRVGVLLKQLSFTVAGVPDGTTVTLIRRGLEDTNVGLRDNQTARVQGGRVSFGVQDHLYSKRRFKERKVGEIVPASYVFQFSGLGNGEKISEVSLKAVHPFTGEPAMLAADGNLAVSKTHKKNIVWWAPDSYARRELQTLKGSQTLTRDLVLNKFQDLVIAEGTQLRLEPGVSIIVSGGNLRIEGTVQHPVTIHAASDKAPWGVLAVLDGGRLDARHVTVAGSGWENALLRRFDGAVTLYGSSANLRNSRFVDGFIVSKYSDVTLEEVAFDNPAHISVMDEESQVEERNVSFSKATPVLSSAVLSKTAYGTPPRAEREYKWSFGETALEKYDLEEIADEVLLALKHAVSQPELWNAPGYTGNAFYPDEDTSSFAFRDIYFDTDDLLNYKHDVSYRLRNRFDDIRAHKNYLKHPHWSRYWPYRLEFQAKVNRTELGSGFSTVDEARFEFRKESAPFSEDNLPPPPRWDLREYVPAFQTGMFRGLATEPAHAILKFYQGKDTRSEFEFKPKVVIITERIRQHLNMKSPWGSGPNPEQSYIISVDGADVYDARDYIAYETARARGDKTVSKPKNLGSFAEIEVEFERNVSDVLDKKIVSTPAGPEREKLVAAREAFLEDQQTIMKVIQSYFARQGIDFAPADESKYIQAFDVANPTRVKRAA